MEAVFVSLLFPAQLDFFLIIILLSLSFFSRNSAASAVNFDK